MISHGTRILVTGSSRGIGAAIARRAGQFGARVVINFLANADAAAKTADVVRRNGGEAVVIRADVRDRDQVGAMYQEIQKEYGGLDVLINNAHSPFQPAQFQSLSWNDIDEQIVGCVRSCFNCTQAAVPYLRSGENPSVLNISSITTRLPVSGFSHRNIAKAAVEGLTRSLALEFSSLGIRINTLAVGWTNTDQLNNIPKELIDSVLPGIPLSRLASPEEIANAALFLVSPSASYITGMVMPVAGGLQPDPTFGTERAL